MTKPAQSSFRKAGVVHFGHVVEGSLVQLLCDWPWRLLRSTVLYTDDPVDCMNCLVEEARRL